MGIPSWEAFEQIRFRHYVRAEMHDKQTELESEIWLCEQTNRSDCLCAELVLREIIEPKTMAAHLTEGAVNGDASLRKGLSV
jgi:hypothetical protein